MKKTVMFVLMGMMMAPFVMAQDLTGEWVSVESWGVKNGQGQHRLSNSQNRWINRCEIDEEKPTHSDPKCKMQLTITEQSEDGRSFYGKRCSQKKCEPVMGVVKSNGDILMADEDGYFDVTMQGEMMELCYLEASQQFQIAVCENLVKK